MSYPALMMTIGLIDGVKGARYKALLTIIPPRPSRDGDETRRAIEERSIPVFKAGIRRFISCQKAALAGVPVYKADDPRAQDAWEDYLALGKEILP